MKITKEHWLNVAEVIDAFRLVPRGILLAYGLLVWYTVTWFMGLPNPLGSQSTLVSVVVGAAAVVIGLYTNSGRRWDGSKPVSFMSKNPTQTYVNNPPQVMVVEDDRDVPRRPRRYK